MKNIQIDRDVLYDLYITQNMSTKQIGAIVGVSKATIQSKLVKYGIVKDKQNIFKTIHKDNKYYIDKDTIYDLYITKNKSVEEVAKILDVSKFTITDRLKRYGIKKDKDAVKLQTEKNNLEKYGTKYPVQLNIVQEKTKKTNLERYGCEYVTQSDEIKDKIKNTNMEKYGCECSLQNNIVQEKTKQTNLEKYGVEYSAQAKEVKNKIKASLLNNNFPNVIEYFANKETTEEFLKKNYNEKTTLIQLSKDTGVSIAAVGRYIHKYGWEDYIDYSSTVSQPEKDIVEYLASKGITNIVQSDRDILDGKEIDIYIPSLKLGFEFNGNYWHSSDLKYYLYHQEKSILAKSKGINLIHIFEYEWLNKQRILKFLTPIT